MTWLGAARRGVAWRAVLCVCWLSAAAWQATGGELSVDQMPPGQVPDSAAVDLSADAPGPALGRGLDPTGRPPAHWPADLDLPADSPSPIGLRASPDALPGPSSGLASWYSHRFHGRPTASGEPYSRFEMTAAHRTLPLGSLLHVTNPDTGVGVVVRINDRGPFHGNRLIDLSHAAASALGIVGQGVGQVDIRLPSADEATDFARRLADAAMRPVAVGHTQVRPVKAAKPVKAMKPGKSQPRAVPKPRVRATPASQRSHLPSPRR